ncbi:hypothetical protein SAY87_024167 [Trapa incisa]|uniref:Pentatricopeptide repeat-containing protein n=1 Tax=Trapa incisa TaxID=236973 RepID=A0AAN7QSV0_9MYRT|nr:hypothetical protein SAY87_024167 [Trapa incisa]
MYPVAAISRSRRILITELLLPVSYWRAVSVAGPSRSPIQPLSSAEGPSKAPPISSGPSFSGFSSSRNLNILEGRKSTVYANSSFQGLLFELLDVIPGTARCFLRVSELKPRDVLRILGDFQAECENGGFGAAKVEPLWRIFNWALQHDDGFKRLPSAYKVMALLLTRAGLLSQVESLLCQVESQGLVLDIPDAFSTLVGDYAGLGELERAVSVYGRIRRLGFTPLPSCYHALIDLLVRKRKSQLAYSVCWDMVETRTDKLGGETKRDIDNVVRLLCGSNRIQEVRNLVKKVTFSGLGWEPCSLALNAISVCYCEKKNFDDLLSLYRELRCVPDSLSGNRAINAICLNFGSRMGDLFRLKLEDIGFKADEVTFGILICWSCHEGNLRTAFLYLSESLSRGLKANKFSYNALICGMFHEGMWSHVHDILDEMVERGILPDFTMYRILLAGYCKARKFDLVKNVIDEMQKHLLLQLSPLEDPVSKAFVVLGFSPQAVQLKRDSHAGFSRAEFFDSIGNGLYLESSLVDFDSELSKILQESIVPDFDALILKECVSGNPKLDLSLVHEMFLWGQDMSLPILSALVKELCLSRSSVKETSRLMEMMPTLFDKLDEVTLNSLALFFCKKRLGRKGMAILGRMLDRNLNVKSETYTAFLATLCNVGDLREFHKLWHVAKKNKWVPGLDDFKLLLERLCGRYLLPEVLELFERLLMYYPISQVCDIFFKQLCSSGFTAMADTLSKEMERRGHNLDHRAKGHLISGFCSENNHFEALRVFTSTQVDKLVLDPNVLLILIPSLCKAGQFNEAVTVGNNLLKEHSSRSLPVHLALLGAYSEAGHFREVSDLFWDLITNGICRGTRAYDTMFLGLFKLDDLNKVKELLALMVRRNLSLSVSSFRIIVKLMCMQGRVNSALRLKDYMLGQNTSDGLVIYNMLIFYVFLAGKSQIVHSILAEMKEKNFLPDETTYNFIIYGFSHCKDPQSSLHYLSVMMSENCRPNNRSLRSIITCLCGAPELGNLVDLFREMELRAWVYSSTVHNMLVNGLVVSGRIHEAEVFVDRMLENCLVPTEVVYDCLIKQLCREGRVEKAVNLLDLMLKKGSCPSNSSYNSLILSLCADKNLNGAMDIHTEMLLRGLTPSIKTIALLVQQCCEAGQTPEAERLLKSLSLLGETPSREMYNWVISRYHSENNLRKASELVQAMQQFGYEPDFEIHWSVISTLNQSKRNGSNVKNQQGFLSRLLSGSGLSWRSDPRSKQS